MTLPAIGLHDEAVRRPAEVDLEARMVGGGEGEVDERLRQRRGAAELEEADLPLAPGALGVEGGGFGQRLLSSVPVRARQELGDRSVVVELEVLGLRKRSLEPIGPDGRGQVQQRAGDRRDRDALVRGRVTGNEGT
jgi:hypothetical protein